MPYADTSDDYLANACSFSLSVIFLVSLVLKVATLTELPELTVRMSPEQRKAAGDFVLGEGGDRIAA